MKMSKTDFYIRQVDQHTNRQVMREIKNKHIFNIIVDIHPRTINGFFRSVSIIITDNKLQTLNLLIV